MEKEVKILIGFIPIKENPERPNDMRYDAIDTTDMEYYLSKPEYYKPSYWPTEIINKYA